MPYEACVSSAITACKKAVINHCLALLAMTMMGISRDVDVKLYLGLSVTLQRRQGVPTGILLRLTCLHLPRPMFLGQKDVLATEHLHDCERSSDWRA